MAESIFNPNEHLMQIKSRNGSSDYLPVQWRLVWFRSLCPNGTIETEIVHLDPDRETEEETYAWNSETRRSEKTVKKAPGFAVFRAIVKDGNGGVAMGTKSEKAASFPDYIEKAETGAIGRALAGLGYGTQFTGDEFDERHRIVDAPVETGPQNDQAQNPNPTPQISPDVRKLKALAAELGLANNTAAWMAYKKSILGHEVMDRDLAPAQITRINNDLDARKKLAKPAEASKV
jgi:hypothetical protein